MSQKLLVAKANIPAGAFTNVDVQVDQAKLEAAIDSDNVAPFALLFKANANLSLSKIVLKSAVNEDVSRTLLPDSAVEASLDELNDLMKPDAGGFEPMLLRVDHGLKLVVSGTNSDSVAHDLVVYLKVLNLVVGPQQGDLLNLSGGHFPLAERRPEAGDGIFIQRAPFFSPVGIKPLPPGS